MLFFKVQRKDILDVITFYVMLHLNIIIYIKFTKKYKVFFFFFRKEYVSKNLAHVLS